MLLPVKVSFAKNRGTLFKSQSNKGNLAIEELEQKTREQAVIENLKPACLCNKIRKGAVRKAIQAGAKTFEQVSRRTGVGTGPCGGRRCGSLVRGMLGEPIVNCNECGWPILAASSPPICPRCEYAKQES